MKRFILLAALLVASTTHAQQEKAFKLAGNVKGMTSGKLYLLLTDLYGSVFRDTAELINGHFEFNGLSTPGRMAYLYLHSLSTEDPNTTSFFLDPDDSQIQLDKDNFKQAVVSGEGSHTQQELITYEKQKKNRTNDLDYIKANKDSYVSAYLLRNRIGGMTPEEGSMYYNLLSARIKASGMGQFVKSKVDAQKLGLPGSPAKNFFAKNLDGREINLTDYLGKYVLLDFWASWCIPCRKSHPHLRRLYGMYKDKGFEIIGIADDDARPSEWRRAIEKDSIGAWVHVLRNLDPGKLALGDGNLAHHPAEISSTKYGISALPTKILIDPKGKIIGRYTGDMEDLDRQLSELFKD